MSDIFVSYASEDRPRVKVLSQALEAQGWSVWWDRSIPFGQRFHQVIERELAAARSVMVIWSESSVGSDWVRAEAGEGMNRGILVPVAIDDVSPPLVFRQIQTANLAGWQGDQESPVFRKLMADLESLLGAPPDPNVAPLPREAEEPAGAAVPPAAAARPQPEARPEREEHRSRATPPWPWLLAGVLGTALVALLLWLWLAPGEPKVPSHEEIGREADRRDEDEKEEIDDGSGETDEVVKEDPPPPPPPPPSAPPPRIVAFEARPASVAPGGEAKLRWATVNADGVSIEGEGPVEPRGEYSVRPSATTTYRLTARSADGRTDRASVSVTVVRGGLRLREGEVADLDSGATDIGFGSRGDLVLRPRDGDEPVPLSPLNRTRFRVVRTASDCHPGLELSTTAWNLDRLRAGYHLCVRTSEDRLVACRVEGVDSRSNDATLTLDCTPL